MQTGRGQSSRHLPIGQHPGRPSPPDGQSGKPQGCLPGAPARARGPSSSRVSIDGAADSTPMKNPATWRCSPPRQRQATPVRRLQWTRPAALRGGFSQVGSPQFLHAIAVTHSHRMPVLALWTTDIARASTSSAPLGEPEGGVRSAGHQPWPGRHRRHQSVSSWVPVPARASSAVESTMGCPPVTTGANRQFAFDEPAEGRSAPAAELAPTRPELPMTGCAGARAGLPKPATGRGEAGAGTGTDAPGSGGRRHSSCTCANRSARLPHRRPSDPMRFLRTNCGLTDLGQDKRAGQSPGTSPVRR